MSLKEWISAYIKYKDSINKKIENITETTDGIKVNKKTGEIEEYVCKEDLTQLNSENIKEQKIVTLNKKINVDWLLKNWDVLKETKTTIMFVNTKKSEHWAIHPKMHSSITDKSAIKPGINTLFESITEA